MNYHSKLKFTCYGSICQTGINFFYSSAGSGVVSCAFCLQKRSLGTNVSDFIMKIKVPDMNSTAILNEGCRSRRFYNVIRLTGT